MSFQNGYYKKAANLRTREVEEWNTLLVYTPDNPNIHYLNPTAWLIFELCDGRTKEQIEKEYLAAMSFAVSSVQAKKDLEDVLSTLLNNRVIQIEASTGDLTGLNL